MVMLDNNELYSPSINSLLIPRIVIVHTSPVLLTAMRDVENRAVRSINSLR